jgi:AcrR family transcriptional regulator
MAKVTRRDWCAAGLTILRDHGHQALTIERLCAALNKSKGSFYHHFADLDAYLAALLELWTQELTERPIEISTRETSPAKRGARLDAAVRELDQALDLAVRAWSRSDARARQAMAAVDQRRVDYLEELHRGRGHAKARTLAELEYAAFVGSQQLGYLDDPLRATRLASAMHKALALLASASGGSR